jgi:hypothetical protein
MTLRSKRWLLWSSIAIAGYFTLYFSSVQAAIYKSAGPVTPLPIYSPDDGEFIHALFAPAHFIDAAVLRREYWKTR